MIRRVKEHIYRAHSLPNFCIRCYEVFKDDTALRDHQRATEPCPRRPEKALEGINEIQKRALRSRKKRKPELSDEEKWRHIYLILFPNDEECTIPSPFVDEEWERSYQTQELDRYETYLRQQLPAALRRELDKIVKIDDHASMRELSRQTSISELIPRVIEIVSRLQIQLSRSYAQSLANPTNASEKDLGPNCAVETARVEPDLHVSLIDRPDSSSMPSSTETSSEEQEKELENCFKEFFNFDPIIFQPSTESLPEDYDFGSLSDLERAWEACLGEDNGEGPSNSR
ncbi:hypothetical protein BCR34DRAFT_578594 [Clohesyomyces aquaticus]|uniref:C2H2-type domain-containing protein n=1 Tax=Clohesyomyces aquaticus TaxID=1231657 RepID=A0A1Y1YF48_9PLEO|nr:hypothetical protein BCR34DRAFT_578594 [Clohesyomyces aquaticus]